MALELPVAAVLHPAYFALGVAELTDNQVKTPIFVARQVRRANVCHTRGVFEQDSRAEGLIVEVFQHENRANAIVVGHDLTHASDEHIEPSAPIYVRSCDVSWPGDS